MQADLSLRFTHISYIQFAIIKVVQVLLMVTLLKLFHTHNSKAYCKKKEFVKIALIQRLDMYMITTMPLYDTNIPVCECCIYVYIL